MLIKGLDHNNKLITFYQLSNINHVHSNYIELLAVLLYLDWLQLNIFVVLPVSRKETIVIDKNYITRYFTLSLPPMPPITKLWHQLLLYVTSAQFHTAFWGGGIGNLVKIKPLSTSEWWSNIKIISLFCLLYTPTLNSNAE